MQRALLQAKKAATKGEVPVGAIVVLHGEIIAMAYNLRETKKNPVAHAEMLAIEKAARALGSWRLKECILYVTLEPCPMCAGAILQARLSRVVFGAYDEKAGACGSKLNLFYDYTFNHRVACSGGIMQDRCASLLKSFFDSKR